MWINMRKISEGAKEYRNPIFLNVEILLMVASKYIMYSIFWKDLSDALKYLAQTGTDFLLHPAEST